MPVRRSLKTVAQALGMQEQAHRWAPPFLLSEMSRRNRLDDKLLKCVIATNLPRDANCIDIGCNYGVILRQLIKSCPDGSHIAFEPIPRLADRLQSQFPHVQVRREALSDTAGQAEFTVNETTPGFSGLVAGLVVERDGATRTITVPVARLDDLLSPDYRPSLIKIDVEGNELRVLRGAARTLSVHQPIVAFEHGHGDAPPDLDAAGELFDALTVAGLRVFDLDDSQLARGRFLDVYRTGARWNFIAHI